MDDKTNPIPENTVKTTSQVTTSSSGDINSINNDQSSLLGVSIRAWICLLFALTICILAFLRITPGEPLYTLAISSISLYIGRELGKKTV